MPDREVLILGGPKDGDIIAVNTDTLSLAKWDHEPISRFGDRTSEHMGVQVYNFHVEPHMLFGRTVFVAVDRLAYDYQERLARGLLNGPAYHLWRRGQR